VSLCVQVFSFNLAPMRIRKRQVLFSSSESVSPLHLSDPHQSSMVVQLGEGPKPCSSQSQEHVSASFSLDRYQPSDQTLPLIGKLNNGHDYLPVVEESGVHYQLNKLDPLVSKKKNILILLFLCLKNKKHHLFIIYLFFFF